MQQLVSPLFGGFVLEREDGSYPKLLERIAKTELLIPDDFHGLR